MRTIYVVASDRASAQRKIGELLRVIPGAQIVTVLKDPDMRGRSVGPDDDVVVCGDWSRRKEHEIQQLVGMFDSRRTVTNTPTLTYRPGEAPQVDYANVWNSIGTTTTNGASVVEIETMNGQRHVITSAAAEDKTRAALDQALNDLKSKDDSIDHLTGIIDGLTEQLGTLKSWLSGVEPIEDTEIPGWYWCGVCHKNLRAHADDCPAAP